MRTLATLLMVLAPFNNLSNQGGAPNMSKATGILAIAHGGTGSATQNFVDLTTGQTVAGNKVFTGNTDLGSAKFFQNGQIDFGLSGNLSNWALLTNQSNALNISDENIGNNILGVSTKVGANAVFIGNGTSGTEFLDSASTGTTAAGTNQATCTQLTNDFSNVTTVASGTGVCLPPTFAGAQFAVHSSGANTLAIYANPAGGTLNGQSVTSSIALASPPGTRLIKCYSSTLCYSSATTADAN